MKLPTFLSNSNTTKSSSSSSWPWPSCNQPRTLSFRNNDAIFKTINSAYVLVKEEEEQGNAIAITNDDSTFCEEGESIEKLIQGLKKPETEKQRLIFKHAGETNSILEEAVAKSIGFGTSLVLSMESENPFVDFKKSMVEMVEAYDLKDYEGLEELFSWYLRVNGKSNHGYIVDAFIDLLVSFNFDSCFLDFSPSSPSSFCNSSSCDDSSSSLTPCISSVETEFAKDDDDGVSS